MSVARLEVSAAQQQVDLDPLRPLHLGDGRVYRVELAVRTPLDRDTQCLLRAANKVSDTPCGVYTVYGEPEMREVL